MLKYILCFLFCPQFSNGQHHILPSAKSNALGQTHLFNSGINALFNGVESFDSNYTSFGINLSNRFGLKEYSDLGLSVLISNNRNSVGAAYFIRPFQFSTEQIFAIGFSQLLNKGFRISLSGTNLRNMEEGVLRINQLRAALALRLQLNHEFEAIARYSRLAKLSSPSSGSIRLGLQYKPHSSFIVSTEWQSSFQYHYYWSTGFEFILDKIRLLCGVTAPGFTMSFGFALGNTHTSVCSASIHPLLGISPQFSYEY